MPRGPRSALALAVLELLREKPMHPYELQQQLRERGLHHVINLKGGSLYSTVDRLAGAGFVEPLEISRSGRRPERTVYMLTDAGRDELEFWLPELLAQPA